MSSFKIHMCLVISAIFFLAACADKSITEKAETVATPQLDSRCIIRHDLHFKSYTDRACHLFFRGCPNYAQYKILCVRPPSTPEDIHIQDTSSNSVTLAWTDTSDIEQGFRIERSTQVSSGFSLRVNVSANSANFVDLGLNPQTTYYYRMQSFNEAGYSEYSDTVPAITDTVFSICEPEISLPTTSQSGNYVLSWTCSSGLTSGNYRIEESNDWDFSDPAIYYPQYNTAYQFTDKPPQQYCYRVGNVMSGFSIWSDPSCIRTLNLNWTKRYYKPTTSFPK